MTAFPVHSANSHTDVKLVSSSASVKHFHLGKIPFCQHVFNAIEGEGKCSMQAKDKKGHIQMERAIIPILALRKNAKMP